MNNEWYTPWVANGWSTANTFRFRFDTNTVTTNETNAFVAPPEPRNLTDMEWLRAEVDAVRELAFA